MFLDAFTMTFLFALVLFLGGVVIWLLFTVQKLSQAVDQACGLAEEVDADLAKAEYRIRDIYHDMGLSEPVVPDLPGCFGDAA